MSFSRSSSITVGRETQSNGHHHNHTNGHDAGSERINLDLANIDGESSQKRLVIAVDFGTTYSAVSYVAIPAGFPSELIDPRAIRSIRNYPEDQNLNQGDQMAAEVPTEVIYPLDRHFRDNIDHLGQVVEKGLDDETSISPSHLGLGETDQFDTEGDISMFTDFSDHFRWGYQVHEAWGIPATHSDENNQPLSRFKLLLDNSDRTETIRKELNITLNALERRRVVKGSLHVIADFLTHLLEHTQSELEKEGFDESYHREIVLCVPAIWTQKACRDMQTCLAAAMKRADFPGVNIQHNSIDNLFIVSEPEAAAAYMLSNSSGIKPGHTFLLLDAGGGTVDANTYRVSRQEPLRLEEEIVAPGGGLHGSSYLNEGFREHLRERLADEIYLEQGVETINGIVEKLIMDQFEYRIKRYFNRERSLSSPVTKYFPIQGLRDDQEKGFRRGCIGIRTSKLNQIFEPHLKGIADIMEDQIRQAQARDYKIENVVLVGGFGTSISLIQYLQERLKVLRETENSHTTLIRPQDSNTITNAVASGAVLRALNKAAGPDRVARSSYGILRTEPYLQYPEHEGLNPSYDRHDGLPYIKETVDWVLKLGEPVPSVWECEPFMSSHTFDASNTRPLICKEILYVSDRSTQSHYRLTHPNNAGAEEVGEILVDCSFLRDDGSITPIEPGFNEKGKRVGKKHYKVNFTMTIKVVDRDLECKLQEIHICSLGKELTQTLS